MKKHLIAPLVAWLVFAQLALCDFHPSYNPKDWPHHVVKFPDEGTLKDIFDAGIRPYRFPALEKSSLGFKHVRLAIELRTGERLPEIDVEWGDISPLRGGLLSSMEVTSPNLTTQEAEVAMSPFLNKGKRTADQLKQFLVLVAKDPRTYDDPYDSNPDGFSIVWNDVEGPNYVVFFKSSFDSIKPLSIALKVSWFPIRTPLQERSFYEIPVPPPPGYENISMDAPKNFGPDSAVEIARSKGMPITGDRTSEDYEKQLRLANDKARASKPETSAPEPKQKEPKSPARWYWLIGICACIIAALLFRWWTPRPPDS